MLEFDNQKKPPFSIPPQLVFHQIPTLRTERNVSDRLPLCMRAYASLHLTLSHYLDITES